MKKSILLFVFLFCSCILVKAQTSTAPSGSGTQASPYEIATLDNLYWLSQGGGTSTWTTSKYFVLTANIDASDTRNWNISGTDTLGFSPIGGSDLTNGFNGVFDGQGFTISGLYINRSTDYNGLFGAGTGCTLKNIGLTDVDITAIGKNNIGALIASFRNSCTIHCCFSTGNIKGSNYVGGLIGGADISSEIKNCYSMVDVQAYNYVGGFVGIIGGGTIMEKCYSKGLVIASGARIGALYGYKSSTGGNPGIYASFYDRETSGFNGSSSYIAKSTAEMNDINTFLDAQLTQYANPGTCPWQIDSLGKSDSIWNIDASNNGYPYLSYQRFPIRVDASSTASTPDGKAWNTAYQDLQDALAIASSGDQIWVAAGTYYPDEGTGIIDNTRDTSFLIPSGVKVYGGFAGIETELTARDRETNETILSGNIDQTGNNTNNSYHVVKFVNASDQTIVDGFTISGGNADGTLNENGGGILNDNSITSNSSKPQISNCNIIGNNASNYGGGIYAYSGNGNSSFVLNNCIISSNFASNYGGGIANDANFGTSSPVLTNCIISSNSTNFYGGGIYCYAGGTADVGNPVFTNCIISGNSSGYQGGGFYNDVSATCSPVFTNCIISGNSADYNGGGLANIKDGATTTCIPVFANCIVYGNSTTGGQIYNELATPTYSYCNIEGGASNFGTDNGNNIDSDPQFVDATNGDYRIYGTSPCADAGNDAANSESTDIRGGNFGRKLDKSDHTQAGTIDMGAYEYYESIDPAEQPQPLQLVFDLSTPGTVKIPLKGTVDVIIDWGDGSDNDTITSAGNAEHTYTTFGVDTVSILGTLTGLGTYSILSEYQNYLTKVPSWGDVGLQDLSYAFYGCATLSDVPNELPNSVTNLKGTFYFATNFNNAISAWNTENVTNMKSMFQSASAFNQDIGNWNTSNVTNMSEMFMGSISFNKNINTKIVNAGTAEEYTAWDVSGVTDMNFMFSGDTAFNQDLNVWNVSSVTDMESMFSGAKAFNGKLSSWNVANVTNMYKMFENDTAFDQNIGTWNIAAVNTMTNMFSGVTLSTPNYDSLIIGWAAQNVQPSISFHGGNSLYTCGVAAAARDTLIEAPNSWTIADGGLASSCPMQLRFENIDIELQLPLFGTLNCTVNWGDGSALQHFTTPGLKSHTYTTVGNYIVTISGSLTQFGNPITTSGAWDGSEYITEVITFGNIGLTSLHGAFWGSTSIVKVPEELPATVTDLSYCFHGSGSGTPQDSIQNLDKWDVSNVTNMEHLFTGKSNINPDLSNWNTENVTSMLAMFSNCNSFNADISGWNVSRVKSMHSMFASAKAFNQDISGWAVDSVTDMSGMFYNAESFNQNLGSWNVSSVADMYQMFEKSDVFEGDGLANWDVSKVTNMESMFKEAKAFNQDIGDWDVSKVTNMESMFQNAIIFTGDSIGKWTVDSVTTMKSMFKGAAAFNGAIGNWNVDSVSTMQAMFSGATAFNQDISSWDVGLVADMEGMFEGASAFNQDIGDWTVDSVTEMSYMFSGATAFNYSLGNWKLNQNHCEVENMLDSCGMDCESYSSTLKGWAENPDLPINMHFGANGLTYGTDAALYHDSLINYFGWTINGDNQGTSICLCSNPSDGGEISDNQSICSISTPDTIRNSTLPSGNIGELQYKWQKSTESDTTGFSDISGADTCFYVPGNLTDNTWFKRLAKVDCEADWSGAAESNVVKITIEPKPVCGTLTKHPDELVVPESDSVWTTLCPGSCGSGTDILEYRYKNKGQIWSAWSNYASETIYLMSGMDAYEMRTYRTGSCCANSDTAKATYWVSTPKTQAKDIQFITVNNVDVTASWTNGSGTKRAVFVAEMSTKSSNIEPADSTDYAANSEFGSGDQIGTTGYYCVYNGTGNSLTITGLTPNTVYRFMVCEYNESLGNAYYNKTETTFNPSEIQTVPIEDWAVFISIGLMLFVGILGYKKFL